MIKTEFSRRGVITSVNSYYFFTSHSDVVIPGRGFRVFLLVLFLYINHFHYGINIKQFSKWKSYCCCWVTNKATLNSTDVFHWYYLHHPIQLFPSNHPINTRQFAITTEIEGFDTLLFWRISFIYKKSRTRHLDASDTYIILKNNLILLET